MNLEKLILTGLMTALITVTTIVIPIPIPFTNGYVHPGDSMVFMAVLLLGRRSGALAAGFGSAFADVVLGFFIWAPFTFVIKSVMAFIVGLVIEKCAEKHRNIVIACISAPVLWLLFNAAAIRITNDLARNNAANSITAIETNSMWGALLLPVLLILVAVVLRKKEHIFIPPAHIIGMTGGGIFMVFGYYIAEGLIYGNFMAAVLGIPANIAQFTVGFLIAALLSGALQNTSAKRYFTYGAKKADAGKVL
ncbi:MAG: ECF transporter S component [Clostridiales Family XIII bacterium]|nr:ECF transporter S component [Clostridiales Family XIII bacterium]